MKKGLETVKTLIIILLFLAVTAMVFFQFDQMRSLNEYSSGSENENTFSVKTSASAVYSNIGNDAIIPSQIAFRDSKNDLYAIGSGKGYTKEIYSLLSSNIVFMLGKNCKAVQSEFNFNDAISAEGLIYIRYHTPLPAVLVYMHAHESKDFSFSTYEDTIGEDKIPVLLFEIAMFPKNTSAGEIFAVARNASGEVTEFIIEKEDNSKNLSIIDLEIYREAGAVASADFYYDKPESHILPSTLIFNDMSVKTKIMVKKGIEALSKNNELHTDLANILDINTNKTGSYFDENINGTIYMATHGTLALCDDKILYSSETETGGIPLSAFSGKDSDSEHSLYESIAAIQSLASALSSVEKANIGEAELMITGLSRNDDKLILTFGYHYDNIPISGAETAMIIEFSSSRIFHLEYYPVTVNTNRSDYQKSFPAGWVISIAENKISDSGKYTLVYKYSSYRKNEYTAEWIPVKISE